MEKRKLNKQLRALIMKYRKYLDGSSVNEFPIPMFGFETKAREEKAEEMKRELGVKIESLAYQPEARNFTFYDWFYVCSFVPRSIGFCKCLIDSAKAPHEKMFALLLALNNWAHPNHPEEHVFRHVFSKDVTPTSWYEAIEESSRDEFYLLWNLISNFSSGNKILDEQASWVWGFWREKCNVHQKLPYL